jgi:hypothetical protein
LKFCLKNRCDVCNGCRTGNLRLSIARQSASIQQMDSHCCYRCCQGTFNFFESNRKKKIPTKMLFFLASSTILGWCQPNVCQALHEWRACCSTRHVEWRRFDSSSDVERRLCRLRQLWRRGTPIVVIHLSHFPHLTYSIDLGTKLGRSN